MKLRFLGATRQVTGSKFYLEAGGLRLLIDCGMFQEREFKPRNWEAFPIQADQLDLVLLTHAHLDHCGLVPKLVREGYLGRILATQATTELAEIVLLDSARIQEEDVRFKRHRHEREGRRSPHPYLPVYTLDDAKRSLNLFEGMPYDEPIALNERVTLHLRDAGHILGSAMLDIQVREGSETRRLIFSGDIGQWDKPLVRDPSLFEQADYVVMESTYGDRDHEDQGDVETRLCEVINETVARGGNIVIPTFAIERSQELMFRLNQLLIDDRIPHLLAFLDSPMAVNATDVFERHPECLDVEMLELLRSDRNPFRFPGLKLIRSVHESKAINHIRGSCIIMAGSGMCTGGRIKHHLVQNITRPESTILFIGYQAHGTLGRQIVDGDTEVRILGQMYPVRARVAQIQGFSGHADRSALLRWVNHLRTPPRRVFVAHGEEKAALSLAAAIGRNSGWDVSVPKYQQQGELE